VSHSILVRDDTKKESMGSKSFSSAQKERRGALRDAGKYRFVAGDEKERVASEIRSTILSEKKKKKGGVARLGRRLSTLRWQYEVAKGKEEKEPSASIVLFARGGEKGRSSIAKLAGRRLSS